MAELLVRISDNVLGSDAFTTLKVKVQGDRVASYSVVSEGAYAAPLMSGWGLDQLIEWLGYDPTGDHPEVTHEVWLDGQWRWVHRSEDLERALEEL